MKNLILFACLLITTCVFGQEKVREIEEVQVTPPKFTGIENVSAYLDADNSFSLNNYLMEKTVYPSEAVSTLSEGTEVVRFTVTSSGEVVNFKVVNSVSREIDEEVIRVLKTTNGMWKPGYKNGDVTAMEREISISFGDNNKRELIDRFTHIATTSFKKGSVDFFVNGKAKKALRAYNNGIRYLPNDKSLLVMRGLCHYELGDFERAKTDWERIVLLGGIDLLLFDNNIAGTRGYSEMSALLAKKTE